MKNQIKFSTIKQLVELTSDWREIIEKGLDVEKVISSIRELYCESTELISGDYLEDSEYYYDREHYVINYHGNIQHNDDVFFCDIHEEYFPDSEMNSVNDGRETVYWSDSAINSGDVYIYDGEYYTTRGLECNDLVFDSDGDVCRLCDVYYWESDGEYHHYEEEEEEYVRPYHNGSFRYVNFESKTKYTIGFEIEKEDIEVKESLCIRNFESECESWRKEHDGSLNDNSGFELVSPVFQFDIKKIFEHIEENEVLKDHINASFSHSCGGHINLGHNEKTGSEVFELIAGYTPLLYSLYYGRVDKNYSKGKSNEDLKNDNEKYQAIKIHSNRIEFRIFSAVPNIKTLRWRCELINLMLKYPTNDVKKAFYYIETRFNSILKQQYGTKERMELLKNRIKSNSMKFEKVDLSK